MKAKRESNIHWDFFRQINLQFTNCFRDMEHIEFSFPPSVNWYQTQALDVSSQGIVAYGAGRECVVLYPVKSAGKIK